METCANCGMTIGNLETPYVWNERIVCRSCYAKLQSNSRISKGVALAVAFVVIIALIGGGAFWLAKSKSEIPAPIASAPPAPVQLTALPAATIPPSNPPPVKSTPAPQAVEILYGKVSGAAWTVENDGTSNVMRGIPISIVERETADVPDLIGVLKTQKTLWLFWADNFKEDAEEKRKQAMNGAGNGTLDGRDKLIQSWADDSAADSASAVAKALQRIADQCTQKTPVRRRKA